MALISDELLIKNAVLAFMHTYPEHAWIPKYKQLLIKLENAKYTLPKKQGRGRPAKRQRKAQASKDTAS